MKKSPKAQKTRGQKLFGWAISLSILGAVAFVLFFDNVSFYRIHQLKQQYSFLQDKNRLLEQDNDQLRQRLADMKANPTAVVEQIAREEYGMQKQGEKVYRFVKQQPENGQTQSQPSTQ